MEIIVLIIGFIIVFYFAYITAKYTKKWGCTILSKESNRVGIDYIIVGIGSIGLPVALKFVNTKPTENSIFERTDTVFVILYIFVIFVFLFLNIVRRFYQEDLKNDKEKLINEIEEKKKAISVTDMKLKGMSNHLKCLYLVTHALMNCSSNRTERLLSKTPSTISLNNIDPVCQLYQLVGAVQKLFYSFINDEIRAISQLKVKVIYFVAETGKRKLTPFIVNDGNSALLSTDQLLTNCRTMLRFRTKHCLVTVVSKAKKIIIIDNEEKKINNINTKETNNYSYNFTFFDEIDKMASVIAFPIQSQKKYSDVCCIYSNCKITSENLQCNIDINCLVEQLQSLLLFECALIPFMPNNYEPSVPTFVKWSQIYGS